jgi:hypothetical protein
LLLLSLAACGSGSSGPTDGAPADGGDAGVTFAITNDQALPDGRLGRPYQVQIQVAGGVPPLVFTVGGEFAAGLGIDPHSGVFSGTPTTPGHGRLIVGVTDAAQNNTSKLFSIYIVPDPLVITSTAVPTARRGAGYHAKLAATGGVPPLGWTVAPGSSLANGLDLAIGGAITGTPTAAGPFDFRVVVKDAETATATGTFHLMVLGP